MEGMGVYPGELDDDKGGGLTLNAGSRAVLGSPGLVVDFFDATGQPREDSLLKDDLDQGMPPLEPCNWPESIRSTINAMLEAHNLPETMNPRQFVRGPFLWNILFNSLVEKHHLLHEDWVKWWSAKLSALDRTCEETKSELSSGRVESFGIPLECLTCVHKGGYFSDLSSETLVRCAHIACVICLNSVLLWLSIDLQNKDPESTCSELRDEVSRLSDKWKCGGGYCNAMFNRWIVYIVSADSEKEEAMKLLFQWTLEPLLRVLTRVRAEMLGPNDGDDEYAEVNRMSKWGDELCDFLDEYRKLFTASDDTEFLYDDAFYMAYRRTALLHRQLGNEKRTTELLEKINGMLEGIEEFDLMVADLPGQVKYHKADPLKLFQIKGEVWTLLNVHKYIRNQYKSENDHLDFPLGKGTVPAHFVPSSDRVSSIISQLQHIERLSETREMFEQLDLTEQVLNAHLRFFLDHALLESHISHSCSGWDIISSSCHHSPLEWEVVREKQDFFLDICEALGDRQVTAKVLQCCGLMMANHTHYILASIQDAPTLRIKLEEEFNLQLTSSTPECVNIPGECNIVHAHPPETNCLISCLNDPCKSYEHKRYNLRDWFKAFRLIKHSIDIYTDLLYNWIQGNTSNEDAWLKLLESQQGVHDLMLTVHHRILFVWSKIRESNVDPSISKNHPKDVNWKDLVHTQRTLPSSNYSTLVLEHAFHDLFESALVWAERGRARTLMSQLGPWYNMRSHGDVPNPVSLKDELIEFNNNHQAAWNSIISCRSACEGSHIFVEYLIHSKSKSELVEDSNYAMVFVLQESARGLQGADYGSFDFNLDEVEELVNDFYETVPLQRHDAGVVVKLHSILERLYDLLIKPFWNEHLNLEATIVFVPDKMLYRVPFSLLRDKTTQKHLFQLHPIAISPSLRVLQHCERRLRDLENYPLKPEGCILAVGNAAYESNRLPGTAKELEHLRSCFPGRVKTLEEEEATRANFLGLVEEACHSEEEHVFAFIHLGVHGHWKEIKARDDQEENQYKNGYLQFARPPQHVGAPDISSVTDLTRTGQSSTSVLEKEFYFEAESSEGEAHGTSAFGEVGAVTRAEGYSSTAAEDMLPSEDIVKGGFQWRTRLAVLSACNSSRGQDYSDGEVNLPRALMIAGVPAAVVSQWKVSDFVSPKLMKAFYENLQHGQYVATALQSAMLQLSNDNANNIFEWGPFLVWGLPTVRLPMELMTENARMAFPARQLAESLRGTFRYATPNNMRVLLLNSLKAVNTFLEATSKGCVLEDDAIIDAIVAVEKLLDTAHCVKTEEVIALAEEFYALLPFEQFERIELELENRYSDCESSFRIGLIRRHVMYMQAMNGKYQIALEYANKIHEASLKFIYEISSNFRSATYCSPDRAMILRLMGKDEEALQEFDGYLEIWEPKYEDLIQICYLKYLVNDKTGAYQYALRAKRLEGALDKPGYGAFSLGFKALPHEFRQRLLNVDKSTLSESATDWGLPVELWTENARKALDAKLQSESLRRMAFRYNEGKHLTVDRILKSIDTFLEAAFSNACTIEEDAIIKAIFAIEELPTIPRNLDFSKKVIALTEEFYEILSIEQLNMVELEFEMRHDTDFTRERIVTFETFMFEFRRHIMYTQAMKGFHPIALEYVNKMIKVNAYESHMQGSEELVELYLRQERAVILRLMGKDIEALKEFENLLAVEENYECLIQVSYLKDLMEDKNGALEYALRAQKILQGDEQLHNPGHGSFCLGFKALPAKYCQWLLNVDESATGTRNHEGHPQHYGLLGWREGYGDGTRFGV